VNTFIERVASAPISWGICEVPRWGEMLPIDRVLEEMSGLGIQALELGAPGFFPQEASAVRQYAQSTNMSLLGGFTPLVLHDSSATEATIEQARQIASHLKAIGATKMISAAVTDWDWGLPHFLSASETKQMVKMLDIVDDICGEFEIEQVLHPHAYTMLEVKSDIDRISESSGCRWCLDTGHLAIGGCDPVEFVEANFDRIAHVHLKDVNMDFVPQLLSREMGIMDSVHEGLFTVLGQGDVDIAGVISALETRGYQGWYVIEQDTAITSGIPAQGEGPVKDVKASLDFLKTLVGKGNVL